MKNEEAVIHLVSTWPDPILNLNLMNIPVENYLKPNGEHGPTLADSIIRGLFYRKRKFSQLEMLILPKDAAAGNRHQNSLFLVTSNELLASYKREYAERW